MKKYVKPELFYERYELSQHIADCAWELKFASGACKAYADQEKMLGVNYTLFTSKIGCDAKTDVGEDSYQDYCYQNGASQVVVAVS